MKASDRPTFCIYAAEEALFARFADTIGALREHHPRFGVVLIARDKRASLALRQDFREARVIAIPAVLDALRGGWAKRLRVKCFIALGGLDGLRAGILAGLRRRAVPVVAIGGSAGRGRTADHYVVGDRAGQQAARASGIDAGCVTLVDGFATARLVDVLSPFIARKTGLVRSNRRGVLHGLEQMLFRLHASSRIRRLDGLEELREALGGPARILCLGNGPSSEDRALLDVRYDAMFRVNDRWLERGFLTQPHMVFTGSKKTLRRLRHPIFGFSSIETEMALVRRWLPYSLFRTLTYFTPERADLLSAYPVHTYEPSNGAIMLATAVALAPESLVIAGIDLFSDERGAYPGGDRTPNAYAPVHQASSELRFILRLLDHYRGELVIFGEVLNAHWAAHHRMSATTDHGAS